MKNKIITEKIKRKLRPIFFSLFNKFKYNQDGLYTVIKTDFLKDKKFLESYKLGRDLMQDSWGDYQFHWRAYVLYWATNQVKNIEGDFVECGVNTGMFARMIINFINFENLNKNYYLLDTFNGMDEKYSSKKEMARSEEMGYLNVYEQVKETFKNFPFIKIIKGAVPDTLKEVPSEKISFLSIDMNCAVPEKAALDFFWNKLSSGAIIILDDYGFDGHEDQRELHEKFAKEKNVMILPLPTGQGIIIKP